MVIKYLLYLIPFLVSSQKMIKNINIPSCRNCIHYKANPTFDEYASNLNKCNNFGEKNIISDEITYKYADICRNNELMCGNEGKYFVKDSNLNLKLKLFKYYITRNIYSILLLFVSIIYVSKLNIFH